LVIAVGQSSVKAIIAFDNSGVEQWNDNHGTHLRGVQINADGYVIAAGNFATLPGDEKNARLYNSATGGRMWSITHASGKALNCAAINSAYGRSVVAGEDTGAGITTRVLDVNGTELYNKDHGAEVTGCAIGEDNIFATVGTDGVLNVYDADGNVAWTKTPSTALYAVSIGRDGRVAIGGVRTSSATIWVYDADGNSLWTYDTGAGSPCRGVNWDENGNLGYGEDTGLKRAGVLNTSGVLQWEVDPGNIVRGVAMHPTNGKLAIVGSFNRVYVYPSGGGAADWFYAWGATVNGVTWGPPSAPPAPPVPPPAAGEGKFIPPFSVF
jgi:WD40 repeat protein